MKPYRKEKVASLIQTVVSEAITYDLHDPRVASLTTVTRVEMTPDLLEAKVFLSVMGSEAEERTTLAGVKSASGYLRRRVAQTVQLRHCPHLSFMIDEAAKVVEETMRILDENRRLRGDEENLGSLGDVSIPPPSGDADPESPVSEEADQ